MRKHNYWILLLWVCCWAADHWLKLTPTYIPPEGCEVQYSFVGAIIGAVASVASGVAGAVSANSRRKKAEQEMANKKRELKDWRDAEIGSNYLDRADSRAAMRRVFESNKEAQKSLNTEAVKRGMTDEAKVAHAAKLNENYADVVSQIAAAGARHKDRIQQQYQNAAWSLDDMKIQNMMDTSGIDSMVQGITGAAAGLGTTLAGTPEKAGTPAMTGTAISPKLQSDAKNAVGIPKNRKILI